MTKDKPHLNQSNEQPLVNDNLFSLEEEKAPQDAVEIEVDFPRAFVIVFEALHELAAELDVLTGGNENVRELCAAKLEKLEHDIKTECVHFHF